MEKKNIICYVNYDSNGECVSLSKSVAISKSEYDKLKVEEYRNKVKKEERLKGLEDEISELRKTIVSLQHEIKVLKGEEENEESL